MRTREATLPDAEQIHRLILNSNAYQQSSAPPADPALKALAMSKDPENKFLWRFNRQRLEAEQLRAAPQPLGMLAKLEDLAVIRALPLEDAARIMERVGEDMDARIPPRNHLSVEPNPAVAVVKRPLFRACHELRLGHARPIGKLAA